MSKLLVRPYTDIVGHNRFFPCGRRVPILDKPLVLARTGVTMDVFFKEGVKRVASVLAGLPTARTIPQDRDAAVIVPALASEFQVVVCHDPIIARESRCQSS